MKKYLVLILYLYFSCTPAKKTVYQVLPNDVADIQLVLKSNQKFQLNFKDMEEGLHNGKKSIKNKVYKFKGTWKETADRKQLDFKLNKKNEPDLNALFDPTLDKNNSVKVIDNNSISFKKSASKIYIWGLLCEKK
ncbi:MAG: hypothetical protein M3Q56_03805 [Bacteroidota bacterium]|nr:hypothetical protein [Bacteroidota bacterium]